MRLLIVFFAIPYILFAYSAEVKKDSIVITINGIKKSLEKGKHIKLQIDDLICYKSGDGRLVIKIENFKRQLSKKSSGSKCYEIKEGKISTPSDSNGMSVSDMASSLTQEAQEEGVEGVSLKSFDSNDTKNMKVEFK